MRYLLAVALVFLSFFLQGRISLLGISPDLTALLTFYAGMRYGQTKGLMAGIVIGAMEDWISFSMIGPNLLGKGIVGYFSSFFVSGGLLRWTPFLGVIVIFLLTSVDNFIVFISNSMFNRVPALPATALFIAFLQSTLNAPAGILIRPKNVD